jgi:glyoxylase-like metal-dependent hydrolase (beta-lactamase superfamily II)
MRDTNYRFAVGALECVVVSDGSYVYHEPAPVLFANVPKAKLGPALRRHGLRLETWHEMVSPYTGLLVKAGGRRVLVDTGANGLASTTGKLVDSLRTEGIGPPDIDVVILSHAHADHVGGFTDVDGKPAFPNASYVMLRDEWEFWTETPNLDHLQLSQFIKDLILRFAREKLPPVREQLWLVDRETEVVPGVHVIPAPGHTPGHLAVALTSGNEQLLYLGDAVLHPVHLAHPHWYAAVDIVADQVESTRRRLLERAVADGALVHAFHFPFPCLGHVTRHGDAWQWEPRAERPWRAEQAALPADPISLNQSHNAEKGNDHGDETR